MPEVEWARTEDAPVNEKFGGTIRVRTLWQAPNGATAQVVEIDPGACWEGIDLHEPGPEEVYVVSASSMTACAIILPAVSFTIREVRRTCRSQKPAVRFLSFTLKAKAQMDFTELVDLAAEKLGGAVLFANDDFFAPKENLLKPKAPIFIEDKYTDLGKWMDGWESRRRRTPGFDWCIIRLGLPGIIRGVVVDTSFFRGNYPEQCSIEACTVDGVPTVEELTSDKIEWTEILPQSDLAGDSHNPFAIASEQRCTHLRFKIFPDGGVARLRVYGEVVPDWDRLKRIGGEIDLAAVEHGGLVLDCSDMFFGHRHNLIMPGRAADMSDGWETKRRRGPGHDWTIIQLGKPGQVRRLEVDTAWFKGNFPDSCELEGCLTTAGVLPASPDWKPLLARTKLQAHTRHFFEQEVLDAGTVSHLRFSIFPDGGVSRLRVYGALDGSDK